LSRLFSDFENLWSTFKFSQAKSTCMVWVKIFLHKNNQTKIKAFKTGSIKNCIRLMSNNLSGILILLSISRYSYVFIFFQLNRILQSNRYRIIFMTNFLFHEFKYALKICFRGINCLFPSISFYGRCIINVPVSKDNKHILSYIK
jgi:hypothetical protein